MTTEFYLGVYLLSVIIMLAIVIGTDDVELTDWATAVMIFVPEFNTLMIFFLVLSIIRRIYRKLTSLA